MWIRHQHLTQITNIVTTNVTNSAHCLISIFLTLILIYMRVRGLVVDNGNGNKGSIIQHLFVVIHISSQDMILTISITRVKQMLVPEVRIIPFILSTSHLYTHLSSCEIGTGRTFTIVMSWYGLVSNYFIRVHLGFLSHPVGYSDDSHRCVLFCTATVGLWVYDRSLQNTENGCFLKFYYR